MSILLNKNILYDLYINKHMRIYDIAKKFDKSIYFVRKSLIDNNIKIRPKGYGFNIKPEKQLNDYQMEFFDGLMLGDGSICRRKSLKNRYSRGNDFLSCAFKYKEFSKYIKDKLNLVPRINKKIHTSKRYKEGKCEQYSILSSPNIFFSKQRDRWYPFGIKKIPKDCRLTSTSMLVMYLGDGYIKRNAGKNNIHLSTNLFDKKNLQIIINHLNKIKILATVQKTNEIRISSKSSKRFLEYIGFCPVRCYDYKWKL